MHDYIIIAAAVLIPLSTIPLFHFADRSRKLQLFVVLPILVAGTLWQGLSDHWRKPIDFLLLATVLYWIAVECFALVRARAKKHPNNRNTA